MNKYAEMPAAEFAALRREKASRDNRELLDEAACRIDHKETNAEKLAKDTNFLARLIVEYDCNGLRCDCCELDGNPNCLDHEQTKEWLESEVE